MTFRLAVLSDVHGDVHALTDALRHIDAMACDAIVCAGDVVDYGLFPNETLALLAARGIPTVRGNHDRWALEASKGAGGGEWTLTKASRRFLEGTLRWWTLEGEGVRVEVHHGSPRGDMDGIIPPNAPRHRLELDAPRPPLNANAMLRGADVLLCGHTHLAFAMRFGARLIANPGALLRDPAEGADNPPATGTFGVLELPSLVFTVHRARDGAAVPILRSG